MLEIVPAAKNNDINILIYGAIFALKPPPHVHITALPTYTVGLLYICPFLEIPVQVESLSLHM